jgi:dimethylhistidine N-methyltransferase
VTSTQTAPAQTAHSQFAQHVLEGLSHPHQKWLSAEYLYDDVGSALFEAITALPEYGLTRADARLLKQHADEIVGASRQPLRIVELGSGSGLKTRWLLEAAVNRLGAVAYTPIDVSPFALALCRKTLETIAGVQISLQEASYLPGLRAALAARSVNERVMVLFLGSTIGNFPRLDGVQFLMDVRALLRPGDSLLLGADLVKPREQLILAYDDPVGVTAAFNRNLLARINRELGGQFDLRAFQHEARFDARESRIEMHLRSVRPQTVRVGALNRSFRFAADETIWTESSCKFTPESVRELARSSGFLCGGQWIDAEWPFSENLLLAA